MNSRKTSAGRSEMALVAPSNLVSSTNKNSTSREYALYCRYESSAGCGVSRNPGNHACRFTSVARAEVTCSTLSGQRVTTLGTWTAAWREGQMVP